MTATTVNVVEFKCDYPGCGRKVIALTGQTPQGYFGTIYRTLKSGKVTKSNWFACKHVHLYKAQLAVLREEKTT